MGIVRAEQPVRRKKNHKVGFGKFKYKVRKWYYYHMNNKTTQIKLLRFGFITGLFLLFGNTMQNMGFVYLGLIIFTVVGFKK